MKGLSLCQKATEKKVKVSSRLPAMVETTGAIHHWRIVRRRSKTWMSRICPST